MVKAQIVLLLLALNFGYGQDFVVVNGWGSNKKEAIAAGLRKAIEKKIGIRIFSQTIVQDFIALQDTLISESFGLVTNYSILNENPPKREDPRWHVQIKAYVAKDIASKWRKIKIALAQKGNPTVMFAIYETVDGKMISSHGQIALAQKFKELGFKVIDARSARGNFRQQQKLYGQENNAEGILAIASQYGAHLLITGKWESYFHRKAKGPAELNYIIHNYNLTTEIYRTDTSQTIGITNLSFADKRGGWKYSRQSAVRKGFVHLVETKYAEKIIVDLLKSWLQDIYQGTDIIVTVLNIKHRQSKEIVKILRSLEAVDQIEVEHYRNRRLTISMKALIDIHSLANDLEENGLEVVELQKNRLELRFINKVGGR